MISRVAQYLFAHGTSKGRACFCVLRVRLQRRLCAGPCPPAAWLTPSPRSQTLIFDYTVLLSKPHW
jgi:hypothetical protein